VPTELLEPRAPAAPPERKLKPAPDPVLRALDWILETPPEIFLTAVRLVLGGVMMAHATQKIFGWFGGAGLTSTLDSFRTHLGIPMALAVIAILAEFVGSLGLILGFLGRLAAVCIIAVMIGAVLLVHLDNGLFMNWTGTAKGEGFEYHLLAIAAALPILAKGSGAYSIDAWLRRLLGRHHDGEAAGRT
jgi:putative oxidoreductase